MTLGEKLRKFRSNNRLTIKELSDKINVSPSTYHSWENDVTYPSARHFAKITEVFQINAAELVDPEWTITLNQPAKADEGSGKVVVEGNALRMFELLCKNQEKAQKILEAENKRLRQEVRRLETKIKSMGGG
jgi:transcriptional regulator with XRE-family HTH domain